MKNDYYMWLLGRIGLLRGGDYISLTQLLFSTTYEYVLVMDSNRAEAGTNLRSIYALEEGIFVEDACEGPCNVLEMLVALADNLAFDTNESSGKWFFELIGNLGLANQDDDHYDENYILDQLYRWMNRQYDYNGNGSLFPLKDPRGDCRRMELWDQKNAYLIENYPVGNWIE